MYEKYDGFIPGELLRIAVADFLLLLSQQIGAIVRDHAAADDAHGHQHRHQDGQDDQTQHGILALLDTGVVAHMADTCFLRVFQTISALK